MSLLFLSKLLPLFIYPVGLTILAGVAALGLSILGFVRASRIVLAIGLAYLWIASTPIAANWLYAQLERTYPAVAVDALPKADVAIVLGGAIGQPIAPRTAPDAGDAVDRVLHAARIFRAGKAGAILASGGNLPWVSASRPEAELIGDLLVDLGVPRSAIVLDTDSRNTRENALNSAALMSARDWKTALLVTSAAHMPRAVAVFRQAGIVVVPAATDIRVTDPLFESVLDVLPDADALARTTDAMKEYLGLLVYRMRGWA